jgi:XamI restriction endonuclease
MSPILPPSWSDDELELDRRTSITQFREERLQEPLEQYLETFDTYRGVVEELLEATVDLTTLSAANVTALTDPALLEALRYLAGPPISEDDLKVLADASLAPSRLRTNPDMAQRVVETILIALDRRRFPWISEGREPEEAEREAAALASAALMATQRLSTSRRSVSKDAQEKAVADALKDAGFKEVSTRAILTLVNAPSDGEFCKETMFGSRKADFVVGLWDGRKMAIECKVSNSSTNSVKRLNNDAAVKAVAWIQEFGTAQTVPAAVISGVFKAHNLKAAQEAGLSLFWAYKLEAMLDWIESTR